MNPASARSNDARLAAFLELSGVVPAHIDLLARPDGHGTRTMFIYDQTPEFIRLRDAFYANERSDFSPLELIKAYQIVMTRISERKRNWSPRSQ